VDLGPVEIALALAVVLLLFGGTRIAEVGGSLGKGIREFRKAIRDDPEEPPEPEATQAAEQPLRCPSCCAANDASARYCSDCGRPVA
jgi:sec-independent protein translocase protein TatA